MRSFLEIWYFSWKHDTFPLNLRPLVMYLRCSFQFGALTNTLWNLPDYVEMISVVFETSRLSLRAFMMHLWNFLIYLNPSYMTETLLVLSMTLPEIIETLPYHMASPIVQLVKNLPANAGYTRDTSLIPGSVRSPGEGNGSPLQYSCLENSMDSGAWWATIHGVTKSQRDDRVPCGVSIESHSPPPLLDRGPHILLTHREVRWVHCFKRWRCLTLRENW